jgi:hypothetical protein
MDRGPVGDKNIPPVSRGDWVAALPGDPFQIARVGDTYWDANEGWLMNLSIYDPTGERLGRTSDPCGGPGGFEPAVSYRDWRRIETPKFPLEYKFDGQPVTMPDGSRGMSQKWSYHPSVATRPDRTRPKVVRQTAAPVPPPAVRTDYDPKFEAATRRMAAQTIRDFIRTLPSSDVGDKLRAEAVRLEGEAAVFQAEWDAKIDLICRNVTRTARARGRDRRLARIMGK